MGFRNPITTAADVDTRTTPGGAGARLYTDNSNPAAPRGVLEFDDGFANDVPARLSQTAQANTHAENASQSGQVTLSGGSYGSTTAPELDLAVVLDPASGGFVPLAKLAGGPLALADGFAPDLTEAGALIGTPPTNWQPIIRAGSQVVTVNAASFAAVSWPAMPAGLVAAWIVPGDITGGLGQTIPSAYRLSGADIRTLSAAGAAIANGTAVRINYLAIGW